MLLVVKPPDKTCQCISSAQTDDVFEDAFIQNGCQMQRKPLLLMSINLCLGNSNKEGIYETYVIGTK